MTNLTIIINDNMSKDVKEPKPSKELLETLKELDYMEKHPEEYKVYHNVDKMFEDILYED